VVGFIHRKFARKFTHICKKTLQICVKLGKTYLVGLGSGDDSGQGDQIGRLFTVTSFFLKISKVS
jgi:hypothetical protein